MFGELAYFQTIASIGPVWRTCLFSNKYILISACSENLPIFKQIHINKCFFGELAIGSREDDGDDAEGEEVDAGDHKETKLKFVSVVRTKQGGRRLFKPDVHLEVKKIEISLFQQRCP